MPSSTTRKVTLILPKLPQNRFSNFKAEAKAEEEEECIFFIFFS
jgi:hypothetical protein